VLTNNALEQVTNTTLVQPGVRVDGRYPLDFATLMTIAHLMALPESRLDRLLEDYDIPSRGFAGYSTRDCDCNSTVEQESRLSKLSSLLGFLGARQIADALRSGPGGGGGVSGSRPLMMSSRR
jgi:transposase-like protein